MKILIVRHGDPIYETDSLTEKGVREAELLSERLCKENITKLYCSTLGRARLTAKPTLDKLGITAEYCDWLREFHYATIKVPYLEREKICWDIMPSFLEGYPEIYSPTEWRNVDFIKNSTVSESYDIVCEEFDKTLEKYGYKREGNIYKVTHPNDDTLVFVCHFGVTAQILSHLLCTSPFSISQNCLTLPTSVTTLYSEEREEGTAIFRMCGFGDVSHLYKYDEEPAFSGRFCERFTDDTRH
ncbi:MAG: histidine phosphatase family protein [Oscillospiraceae bacterium]|nr:histidine phosphatase family protein [Oscillospiraceae bacterium]